MEKSKVDETVVKKTTFYSEPMGVRSNLYGRRMYGAFKWAISGMDTRATSIFHCEYIVYRII